MNRRPPGLLISKSIDGFVTFKLAEGLSKRTVDSYEYLLRNWLEYCGDKDISTVKPQDITRYLTWLRTEYKPRRYNGNNASLSGKTLRNIWITFRSFFGWLHRDYGFTNPVADIAAPKFQKQPVAAFSKEEVEKILKACIYTKEFRIEGKKNFVTRRPSANRDQAIILTLLDTGLRATELCFLTIRDLDMTIGKLTVRHGVEGGAKGGKGRTVYLGKVARKSVWRYLATREDGEQPSAPLFLSHDDKPFNKDSLRRLVSRIGERAEVLKVYPHKFRHTFAITYLRSGGDVFTLQSLLGHGSLDMVRHYAQIAEMDVENAHRKASPADNWRL